MEVVYLRIWALLNAALARRLLVLQKREHAACIPDLHYIRFKDTAPEIANLFGGIDFAEIAEVVFAFEAFGCVAHGFNVEPAWLEDRGGGGRGGGGR